MRKLCRVLFSRYFISATLIGAELALIFYLLFFAYNYTVYALVLFGLVNLVALIGLITRDANPEYKIPWLVIITLLPPFGALLCAIFYSRKPSRKKTELMREIQDNISELCYTGAGLGIEKDEVFDQLCRTDALAGGKALGILTDDRLSSVYRKTSSKFFSGGEDMFEDMMRELSAAKRFIFLEYFIIEDGYMWGRIYSVLKEKVKEGVEVRVIYDDIGCMRTLPSRFDRGLRRDGIKCIRFSPVSPRISTTHNNRDHRKIMIIDGEVAYTGGINIADEYVNKRLRFGHWKDGGIRIRGEAVLGLLKMFLSMWDFTLGSISNPQKYMTEDSLKEGDGGYYIPFGTGPSPIYERPVGKNVILNIVNQAKRYVYITTPYLIVDYDLTEALRNASLRGVDVRIITPGVADKKIVKVMTKSSYPYLMEAGVQIYEYTPGFIHEKCIVSDDIYAMIGTINLDYRSLVHHYEDAVWIYASPTVVDIKSSFLETLSFSERKDREKARLTAVERIVRNAVRLFAPLL